MPEFFFLPDRMHARQPGDDSICLCKQFRGNSALSRFFQKCSLFRRRKNKFLRIRKEKVRLFVSKPEIGESSLSILFCAASYAAFPAIL